MFYTVYSRFFATLQTGFATSDTLYSHPIRFAPAKQSLGIHHTDKNRHGLLIYLHRQFGICRQKDGQAVGLVHYDNISDGG